MKLTFLSSENPPHQEQGHYITSMSKPSFLIRIHHEDDYEPGDLDALKDEWWLRMQYQEEVIWLQMIEVFNIPQEEWPAMHARIQGIMARASHWYRHYLEWEDDNLAGE